ncbi:MAG: NAD(P)/FAD-dependent oxidoreductase [Gordonia sp. (in: high G+C Gram-positive bacteria)]
MSEQESGIQDEVDAVVIGTGVTGVYQLYRLIEGGYTALALEAGNGVGGTWYWNRYPQARFDSESYSYGYLFSQELWDEWEWTEHFAGQPEIERYFNHVVDKFDLRQHIRFGAKVNSAIFDEGSARWTITDESGRTYTSRYLIAATGVLSVPFIPDIPGREDFAGEAYHTGRWPKEPVDVRGKRVALIGTGSSGVQIVPAIADEVASLTVFQRTPDWCTPLNNSPITPDEQAELKRDFEQIRDTLNTSVSGFLHTMDFRLASADPPEVRRERYEKLWASPGFRKLTQNYIDMTLNPEVNKEFCEFLEERIRALIDDQAVADKLIPKDHLYGGRRPPFVTGYYEAYNKPNVELVSLRETPIRAITADGIDTGDTTRQFDIIIWATGWDFGTGALNRLGVSGRDGLKLSDYWKDGPRTYLGVAAAGFPNFFFPGGPHGATGNNPRYAGDQVDFVMDVLDHARRSGADVVEVTEAAEDEWTATINSTGDLSSFLESSYFYGSNIPGKPVSQLLNPTGRPGLQTAIRQALDNDLTTFRIEKVPSRT